MNSENLKNFALQIRLNTMTQFKARGFGHIGGAFSIAEVLAVLYGNVMKIDPTNPHWKERDYLVLSKGHAGPALYATLALKGFFPQEWLTTLNQPGTRLPSHADRNLTPGVDVTTGSLGQGLSVAAGIALSLKSDDKTNKVYCIVGDGECNEGQIWEAAMFAAHHKLPLIVYVDYNKKQLDGNLKEVLDLGNIGEKFKSFGFSVTTVKGNDADAVLEATLNARNNTPSLIVLDTIKGAGVKFVEELDKNHHLQMDSEFIDRVINELKKEGGYDI